MFFTRTVTLCYLIVEAFADQDSSSPTTETVKGQSYRRINFTFNIWNLISSKKTENVTIVNDGLDSGTIECGVACHVKSECGGFVYDKKSGSCSMKRVNIIGS